MNKAASYCLELIKQGDRERYLALLFAPDDKRFALAALYAFNLEIARIRDSIHEPLAGEIRLRWWRDRMEAGRQGDSAENPVLDALFSAMDTYKLPKKAFLDMCDARIFDLYHDPMPSIADLEGYFGETASMLIQLSCQILDEEAATKSSDAAGHAGVAQGLCGLIRLLPIHGARQQLFIPADMLKALAVEEGALYGDKADQGARQRVLEALMALSSEHYKYFRTAYASLPKTLRPAFLPLSTVPCTLEKASKMAGHAFDEVASTSPLRRWWVMAKTAISGRFPL